MPCYSDYTEKPKNVIYQDRDNPDDKKRIAELTDQNRRLEAGLCAIITELEERNIADKIISQASKSGLIDLMDFWRKHSKDDESRLAEKLHRFSEHEQKILKRLLNNK